MSNRGIPLALAIPSGSSWESVSDRETGTGVFVPLPSSKASTGIVAMDAGSPECTSRVLKPDEDFAKCRIDRDCGRVFNSDSTLHPLYAFSGFLFFSINFSPRSEKTNLERRCVFNGGTSHPETINKQRRQYWKTIDVSSIFEIVADWRFLERQKFYFSFIYTVNYNTIYSFGTFFIRSEFMHEL